MKTTFSLPHNQRHPPPPDGWEHGHERVVFALNEPIPFTRTGNNMPEDTQAAIAAVQTTPAAAQEPRPPTPFQGATWHLEDGVGQTLDEHQAANQSPTEITSQLPESDNQNSSNEVSREPPSPYTMPTNLALATTGTDDDEDADDSEERPFPASPGRLAAMLDSRDRTIMSRSGDVARRRRRGGLQLESPPLSPTATPASMPPSPTPTSPTPASPSTPRDSNDNENNRAPQTTVSPPRTPRFRLQRSFPYSKRAHAGVMVLRDGVRRLHRPNSGPWLKSSSPMPSLTSVNGFSASVPSVGYLSRFRAWISRRR